MKAYNYLFSLIVLMVCSCSSGELSKTQAREILSKEYTKELNHSIYTSDPQEARKLMSSGLADEGYVVIKTSQSFENSAQPLISFTGKATPFLVDKLPDPATGRQRVKIANAKVSEVVSVTTTGKEAVVVYKLTNTDLSPFARLMNQQYLQAQDEQTAHLVKNDDGQWALVK